jgi:hypothetical protein
MKTMHGSIIGIESEMGSGPGEKSDKVIRPGPVKAMGKNGP